MATGIWSRALCRPYLDDVEDEFDVAVSPLADSSAPIHAGLGNMKGSRNMCFTTVRKLPEESVLQPRELRPMLRST